MRQKTINLRNQGSFDKKIDFFSQTLSHIPRWVCLEQKTQAKNSHAWAPLSKEFVRHIVQYLWRSVSFISMTCLLFYATGKTASQLGQPIGSQTQILPARLTTESHI